MDTTTDDLNEPPTCDSIAEAEQLVSEQEAWKAGPLQEASSQYNELNGLVEQLAELGSSENPYTPLEPQVSPLQGCGGVGQGEGYGEEVAEGGCTWNKMPTNVRV